MVGFLSEDHGERNWGLIRLPNTQIYKLELGDSIGLEQGLVMAITPKKIFVQRKDLNNRIINENREVSTCHSFIGLVK